MVQVLTRNIRKWKSNQNRREKSSYVNKHKKIALSEDERWSYNRQEFGPRFGPGQIASPPED